MRSQRPQSSLLSFCLFEGVGRGSLGVFGFIATVFIWSNKGEQETLPTNLILVLPTHTGDSFIHRDTRHNHLCRFGLLVVGVSKVTAKRNGLCK